ncbi:MAG: PLP-dependent aminotransferase family protein [Alphaproteobacteria bacterium]|nr:PLP-dependent aminotransferase family protein [Alphaproteobacteria bacterium]
MTIWPPHRQELRRPAYRSLAERLLQAIEAGELRSGDRLPPHRVLADQLGLSVQTVSRAYGGLMRRGVLAGEVGRGTFVRTAPVETRTPYIQDTQDGAIVDCSILKPVCTAMHQGKFGAALAALSDDLPMTTVSSFRPSVALSNCRRPALDWLRLCGLEVTAERVLLTNGASSAMTIALMTAANPGDLVVTEALGHHTLKPLTGYLGFRLQGLEIDGEGIVPQAFERACLQEAVKALYIMPSGLNPTASTAGIERRERLAAIARKHGVLIIENDAWGPVQPSRPPPIAALAPERTFYVTSFTKCLMPGLRVGYLVTPETFESAAASRHLVTNWMATPLLAEIASRWIVDGTAEALLLWQREALVERNALAAEALAGLPFSASPAGMHVWLPLPHAWSEEAFVAHTRLHGVAVAPGSAFAVSAVGAGVGVRICLGAESTPALERGLSVIARLARSQPEPALLAI